ncbi:MAG: hypothetical protein V4477_18970 [Pseudomonadota bacterium]
MTRSSNPVTGDSSRMSDEVPAQEDVFSTRAHVNVALTSAAPDEDALDDCWVYSARPIHVVGRPIEQKWGATSASACAQISEEEEYALYQFDQACVALLREDLSLLGFAFTVMETVQSFLDDCDIKSPASLEERLDENQLWHSLMLSIAGHPIKQKLSLAVRDMELDIARDRISWMLDGGRTY